MNSTDIATHRLSLLLLCDLLKALDIKDSNGIDINLIADVVELGHRWAIPKAYPQLLNDCGAQVADEQVASEQNVLLRSICAVQRHLNLPSDSGFAPESVEAFIDEGKRWALPFAYPTCSGAMEPPEHVVEGVFRVLLMWDNLELAIEQLPVDDRSALKKEADAHHVPLRFNGFDPESEASAINVAQVYVRQLNMFPRFRHRAFYVLAAQMHHYERMLDRFDRTGNKALDLARLRKVLLPTLVFS